MPRIDFDYDDLDQFTPQVREAILRLDRQQDEAATKAKAPTPSLRPDVVSISKGEDDAKRATLQRNHSGGIVMPSYRNVPQLHTED